MDALAKAKHVYQTRGRIKGELAALSYRKGRTRVADLVSAPPPELEGMSAFDLVWSIHRMPRHRVLRILRRLPVSESRTVKELTERQRTLLAEILTAAKP
jgi:hypothetical protein